MYYNKNMVTGIFGGAFDPPHNEHIKIAKFVLDNYVDKLVFLPSAKPPHKECVTDFADRVAMLRIATKDFPQMEISTAESEIEGTNYTYQMLPHLKAKYGEILFVIGGDSLIDLRKWKNPFEVIKMCKLCVFNRGDRQEEFDMALKYWREMGAKIILSDYCPNDISSTCIRYNIECGKMNDIPQSVANYICENGLYRRFATIVDKLKQNVEAGTFEHIVRTAKCALYLNDVCELSLDKDKVFVAALLHDCAKTICKGEHDSSGVPQDCIGSEIEHQFLGAILARRDYGVDDDEVLGAIEYHTTGKEDMSTLEKLILCADMLEEKRAFDNIDFLRKTIKLDFEIGVYECIAHQLKYLEQNNKDIYPLTRQAMDYLRREKWKI
ncbi:MAG: nicotinate (nicotinamide) nucleotide adenylyltransferase [Clostridia bacterium]